MIFSVSADLDGLGCYAAIHGLKLSLDDRALRAVPTVAVERLCDALGDVRGTFFVIGREAGIAPGPLKAAAQAGHELGNHSYEHHYGLSRLSAEEIERDLSRAHEAILREYGVAPRGFRAPGYTLSERLLKAASRYDYDSSLLPSPSYYFLKVLAIAAKFGRSASILGGIGQLFARRGPHRRSGVRELPISTVPLLRGPVIGTVALGVSDGLARALARLATAGGHFNLELHGIDVLDSSDVPREIAAAQPGLRTPAAEKVRRLRALLKALRERGGEALTLHAAALRLLP